MIRPREFSTREIVKALPKDQRAQFLALDSAERKLLINGSDEEKEHYGWLPPDAARRFSKLPDVERREEAKQGWRARRLERQAPAPAPVKPAAAEPPKPGLADTSARVAESVRDIFELPVSSLERVQSIATNWLQGGETEDGALNRVSHLLMDETSMLPTGAQSPSRMQMMFGAGNTLRG